MLINGTPFGFSSSSYRVRQGDPLSHFLFVIFMKALSRTITASIDSGILSGFYMGSRLSERVNISHLLFANDTLVFYE
jgi:hypothetical protein